MDSGLQGRSVCFRCSHRAPTWSIIAARGFATARFTMLRVSLGETTAVNAALALGRTSYEVTVDETPPLVRGDNPGIRAAIDARTSRACRFPRATSCNWRPLRRREHAPEQQQRDW